MAASTAIASLEEPLYQPEASDLISVVETEACTFPGTELTCWRYTGQTSRAIRDRLGHLLKDPEEQNPCLKFPGPQPVSIDRTHFDCIRRQRYAVALKTDGVRACMFITDVDDVHMISLFDRTMKETYGVFIHNVPRVWYQVGTVLDGELVFDMSKRQWTFLAFDCFLLNGFPQYHKNLWDRLHALQSSMHAYAYTPSDTIVVALKQFTSLHLAPVDGQEHQLQQSTTLPTDGYIFMPVDQGIVFGHHPEFFKLKTCHSVDFVYKTGGGVFVYNQQSKRLIKAGVLEDPPDDLVPGAIVEAVLAQWHPQATKRTWKLLHVRVDKSTSNTLFTLEKTLVNMQENLGYGDIRSLVPAS